MFGEGVFEGIGARTRARDEFSGRLDGESTLCDPGAGFGRRHRAGDDEGSENVSKCGFARLGVGGSRVSRKTFRARNVLCYNTQGGLV